MTDLNTNKSLNNEIIEDEINLQEIALVIWSKRYLLLAVTFTFSLLSIFYSLLLPNYYQSESILVSTDKNNSSPLGQYSDLASLAGLSLNSGVENEVFETIELIKSREFVKHILTFTDILPSIMAAKEFNIETNKLIYKSEIYDQKNNEWKGNSFRYGKSKPSYLEVHKVYLSQLNIFQDKKTNFISMSFEHVSPIFAKDFLSLVIREANSLKRQRDLDTTNNALEFLKAEFRRTSLKEIKISIQNLIESQLETRMLAKVNNEYSLSILEPPFVPELKSRPKRSVIVIISTLLGFLMTIFCILVHHFFWLRINKSISL